MTLDNRIWNTHLPDWQRAGFGSQESYDSTMAEYETSEVHIKTETEMAEEAAQYQADLEASVAEQEKLDKQRRIAASLFNGRSISMANLAKLPRDTREPIIEKIAYPGSMTILAADPKAGKTTTLLYLFNAMRSGASLLGLKTRKGATVLYASEQTDQSLTAQVERVPNYDTNQLVQFIPFEKNFTRVTKQVLDAKSKTYIEKEIDEFPTTWESQIELWREEINRTRPDLFIVDTFSAFGLFKGGEAFDAGPVTTRLQQLKTLIATKPDLSIVVCHHLRKEFNQKGGDRQIRTFNDIANSYALRAASDLNVILYAPSRAKEDKNLRTMRIEGRFIEEECEFDYRKVENDFILEELEPDSNDRDVASEQAQSRLSEVIKKDPSTIDLSERKLAQLAGVSARQVRKFRDNFEYPLS